MDVEAKKARAADRKIVAKRSGARWDERATTSIAPTTGVGGIRQALVDTYDKRQPSGKAQKTGHSAAANGES